MSLEVICNFPDGQSLSAKSPEVHGKEAPSSRFGISQRRDGRRDFHSKTCRYLFSDTDNLFSLPEKRYLLLEITDYWLCVLDKYG